MNRSILHVGQINKAYKIGKTVNQALRNVSFSVEEGTFLVIMGRSGSGKSTLLNILGSMDDPDQGDISVQEDTIQSFSNEKYVIQYRRNVIGFVFQHFNLLKDLTAEENIALPLVLRGAEKQEIDTKTKDILDLLELSKIRKNKPFELSGGQQQRVAIGRAIIHQPQLLLADEPTGNLDYDTTMTVMDIFKKVNTERKQTTVIVTHDPYVAQYADRLMVLHDGAIIGDYSKKKNDFSVDFVLDKLKQIPKAG